jgi:hypothetical protein
MALLGGRSVAVWKPGRQRGLGILRDRVKVALAQLTFRAKVDGKLLTSERAKRGLAPEIIPVIVFSGQPTGCEMR